MNKSSLYPIKFNPILKPTIWGGTKLGSVLSKPLGNIESVGESWEISGVKDNISVVANGTLKGEPLTDLISQFKGALVGEHVYEKFSAEFPLLIKFIDAQDDLSIQVHPDDALAKKRHNSFGKTEMWYVVDAEDGASLISGFNKETNKEEYVDFFKSGRLTELLNREQVTNDEVYFLPAGRVHTIGKGLLIAEIQQTSNITYRIYDFDRVDKEGNTRELHVDAALDAIDFKYYDNYKTIYNKESPNALLASCNYFICNRILLEKSLKKEYASNDSFVILMVLAGNGKINTLNGSYAYTKGDTYLIPACIDEVILNPASSSKILEIYIPS